VAIAQTGSILRFPIATDNTGTASSTITVPGDADFVAVGVSGYSATSTFYSTGSLTFTKGGSPTAMTSATSLGDTTTSAWMSAMFYMLLPDTGSNKTLAWDWVGAGAANYAPLVTVIYYTGVDSVRGTSGGQAASGGPYTTGTLTAVSGDLILAVAGGFSVTEGTVATWSNLTLISQVAFFEPVDQAWAAGSPSGNTTVAASTTTVWEDGGIVAVTLVPSAGATVSRTSMRRRPALTFRGKR
jgi:hypothetical protein